MGSHARTTTQFVFRSQLQTTILGCRFFNYACQFFHKTNLTTDFFVDPIFDVNSVQRELMNINSEHRKNIKDDGRRINSVIKQLSNHPYNKFATGDLMTLKYLPELNGISVRDEVIKYYQQFYSSNIMTACIFAKDDKSVYGCFLTD